MNKNDKGTLEMKNKLARITASYFGIGFAPKAPGTMGSLATLPLAFVLAYFWGCAGILAGAAVAFFAGVWATNEIISKQDEKDPSFVVIDETAGQLTAFLIVAPQLQTNSDAWAVYLTGFALFRFFDILKAGPVKWADSKLKNAWGVMLDDIFAGMFAAVILAALTRIEL